MAALEIVATGYPSLDYIMRVRNLPAPGETGVIQADPPPGQMTPGGCAANVAVGCARLGMRAGLLMVVGDDFASSGYRAALTQAGVDLGGIHIVPGATSFTYLFFDPQGRHQTFFFPGVVTADVVLEGDEAWMRGARWGVITVGVPEHNRAVAEQFHRLGIPIVWAMKGDPFAYPQDLLERLVEIATVAVMNQAEAEALCRLFGWSEIRELLHPPLEMLFVTLGTEGSRVITSQGDSWVPAVPPDQMVDPTGAGDGYLAGLLWALTQGLSPTQAAQAGAIVASFVLEATGCQTNLPTLQPFRERYRHHFGEFR